MSNEHGIVEVDVWLRGENHATTARIPSLTGDASAWSDADVRQLLVEMLLALNRQKHPDGEEPEVSLRGFNWIVSEDEPGGVLLHVEMALGSASAGPFNLTEPALTAMVARVMADPPTAAGVH